MGWGMDGVGYGWLRQCGVRWGEVGWSESQNKSARASPLQYHLSEAVVVRGNIFCTGGSAGSSAAPAGVSTAAVRMRRG